MANPPKKKVFYQIDEVCERLGLSLLDMSVLVSERKIQLCTAVAGLLVEDGHYEVALDGDHAPVPDDRSRVQGLVDLKPDDAWYVLRHGSQTIFWLAAEPGCYRRLVSTSEEDRSCPWAWCNWRRGTAFAGLGRAGQLAIAGRLTAGSSLKGAMVSRDM
jgi:hypothetical protein